MKEKSDVVSRLMKKINDPEWQKQAKQKRENYKKSLTAEYQLGYFVGEDIVNRFLPTLSVEGGTRKEILVSSDEQREYNRLDKKWYERCKSGVINARDEWKELQEYREFLKVKYLPNPLICHEKLLNIRDMDKFKTGLITSLWDCDHCNYSLESEDIEIYDEEDYFTIIKLKLK
jgi:hypothetical protein